MKILIYRRNFWTRQKDEDEIIKRTPSSAKVTTLQLPLRSTRKIDGSPLWIPVFQGDVLGMQGAYDHQMTNAHEFPLRLIHALFPNAKKKGYLVLWGSSIIQMYYHHDQLNEYWANFSATWDLLDGEDELLDHGHVIRVEDGKMSLFTTRDTEHAKP